jgi:hypothetical protein
MKQILKHTAITSMAIFVVILATGIHVSKMQCENGERIFMGVNTPKCKKDITPACKMEKRVCCKKKQKTSSTNSKKGDCNKDSKLVQFDFEMLKYKFGESIDFNIAQPFYLLSFNFSQNTNSELCYIKHYSDAPPLVNQPILSQIQSFLL